MKGILTGDLQIPPFDKIRAAEPKKRLDFVDLENLLICCCKVFNVNLEFVKDRSSRYECQVIARKAYCYLAKEHKGEFLTLADIGRVLGYKHCVVLYHHSSMAGTLEVDRHTYGKILEIKNNMNLA